MTAPSVDEIKPKVRSKVAQNLDLKASKEEIRESSVL